MASLTLLDVLKDYQICLVQDITERKRLEEELLESERSKSVFLSNLPGMAYRCNNDCHWTMQFVSAGCYQLTGYTADDLLYNRKLSFNDIIVPEYREAIRTEWQRTLAERLPFRYEYEITTAKGERKWVLEMGQGAYDEQGEVIALEGIILISDRKEVRIILGTTMNTINGRICITEGIWKIFWPPIQSQLIIKGTVGINLSSVHRLSTYGFHYSQEVIKVAEL